MLVILNGAPKGGSTWLVSIVEAIGKFNHIPGEFREKGWVSASIPDAQRERLIKECDYQNNDFLCKQHWINEGPIRKLNLLCRDNIKMVNIIRDIRDVLVSRFFHDLRLKYTKIDNIEEYYWSVGRNIMVGYMNYHFSWHSPEMDPQPFLCSYEKLQFNFAEQIWDLLAYLDLEKEFTDEDVARFKDITSYDKKPNKGEGRFFRKGIVGDWQNHLTTPIVEDLKNTAIEKGYLTLKRQLAERFNLAILKDVDFGY